ncbi:MAG: choice-of-anchor L domain-containing protein [Flavobacteriia bacterium]|nr:choice-of-anchor L domain-containing protein [Flavobacteriia bacterium]
MIKFITSFVFVSLSLMAFSQSVVVSNSQTPTQLINNVLLGMGVTASNITINGSPLNANAVQGNVVSFTNTNPAFPISSGLLLTTGNAIAAQGPNNSSSLSNNLPATASVASDPHLNILAAGTVTNGVVLEFDFIPTGDTLNFRYLFGSEEYPEFAPPNSSGFNDAFGFFLWGPGITGPYVLAGYPNGANIATIPGGTPVTINNVCPTVNPTFYVNNMAGAAYGTTIQYDGTTVLLTAAASVQCNQTYHIKLAISNVSDVAWDSGVFLEANSFSSNVVDVAVATVSGDTTIIEGCNFADIVFTRPEGNMLDTLSIIYTIGGTATEGVDYANLMDTIIFLPGVDTVIVNLSPLQDNIIEGYESVIISVNIINPCGDTIVSSGTIYVWDGPIIDSLWSTNANCLPTGSVHVDIVAPSVPATYLWTSPNALTFSGPDWQNINPGWYYITVTQAQCSVSDSVEVLLTAPPLANFSVVAPLSNCQPAAFSFVNNSLNATSYNWTFGDGNGSAGNNPSHTYSNQTFGTYTVQLIAFVDPLCASDTTLTINLDVCACIDPTALNFNALANIDDGSCIYPFPEVFAPNVFTPNSDAENPTYFLSGKNLVSLELTILNRWGAVVFSKSSSDLINNNPAWDGKINGDLATDGIYFYIYKATGITNQVVEGHGFLHLISDK